VKHGYGFITPVITHGDDDFNEDIFVHHTSLYVQTEQYKYLTEGEYVDFNLERVESTEHKYHAVDVTGVARGFLLCETRFQQFLTEQGRKSRNNERCDRERPRTVDDEPQTPRTPRARDDEFEFPKQKKTFTQSAFAKRQGSRA